MPGEDSLLLEAVAAALRAPAGARVAVACSGGLDSLVLADAAARVLGEAAVVVLHVDHGLGARSAEVAAEVAAWARARGVAFASRRVTVARQASLEAAARAARYAALDELADEHGVALVATAHTARDQAETVLLRILRGTGVAGLAAIPARRGRFVRPLLALGRQPIEAYARARGLTPWDDPMNHDERFARVRVRQRHLPALRAENPALDRALLRLAEQAAEWTAAIDAWAEPLAARLSARELGAAPPAVRKRALGLALARAGASYDADAIDRFDELVLRPAAGTVTVSLPGVVVMREYDAVRVGPPAAGEPAQVPAELRDPAQYHVRTPLPGDRMRPARLGGRSRKLSDLFVDAKVPRRLRQAAAVVCRCDDGQIVWVEHVGWSVDGR